jgi:hypothetical protein
MVRPAHSISHLAATAAIMLAALSWSPASAVAGEKEARDLVKAMSDYLGAQKAISFSFDTNLEVVTNDHQKLLLASSGRIDLGRPDKIRASRNGGFANVEMTFDGKTATLIGKDANLYMQVEAPGTIYDLVALLRDKLGRPVPGADLLLPDVYDELMVDAIDVKDLGTGVIGRGVRSSRIPKQGRRLADLDRPRPAPLPLQIRDHRQQGRSRAAIQHPDIGVEDRH